jgi:hypothetical protein
MEAINLAGEYQRAFGRSAALARLPPWHVYRITPKAATALATVEPGGATRWWF